MDKNVAFTATTNVEILPKLPCEKSYEEQLEVMEEYTRVHKASLNLSKEQREINGLKVLYPRMLRSIADTDLIAGRYDVLPIGFGCVTSLGGVGHYCLPSRMETFRKNIPDKDQPRVDALLDYWKGKDIKAEFIDKYMDGVIINAFSNVTFNIYYIR